MKNLLRLIDYFKSFQKYFINNSFDFKLQSIGIYSNIELMYYSCKILIKKLFYVVEDLKNNSDLINEVSSFIITCSPTMN